MARAVGQVEVERRDHRPLAVDDDLGQHVDLDDLEPGGRQHRDVARAAGRGRGASGSAVVWAARRPGRTQSGDVVDVAVGVVVLEQAVRQPHDPLDAEPRAERGLDARRGPGPGCGWGSAGTARW